MLIFLFKFVTLLYIVYHYLLYIVSSSHFIQIRLSNIYEDVILFDISLKFA